MAHFSLLTHAFEGGECTLRIFSSKFQYSLVAGGKQDARRKSCLRSVAQW